MKNGTAEPKIDLADLAERCRVASNAVELLPSDSRLMAECADVFESMNKIVTAFPEVVRQNRAHQYHVTCEGVAIALDEVAADYEIGKRTAESPQRALRVFAASLRDSLNPKKASVEKPKLIM